MFETVSFEELVEPPANQEESEYKGRGRKGSTREGGKVNGRESEGKGRWKKGRGRKGK